MPTPSPPAPEPDPTHLVARMLEQKDRDWVLLRTFYLVAECRSYRGAAAKLGLHDATAVRKRIQALERRLGGGTPLVLICFDGTGLKLTAAGRTIRNLLSPTAVVARTVLARSSGEGGRCQDDRRSGRSRAGPTS